MFIYYGAADETSRVAITDIDSLLYKLLTWKTGSKTLNRSK